MKHLIDRILTPFKRTYLPFFLAGFGFSLAWLLGMIFLYLDVFRRIVKPNGIAFCLSLLGGCLLFSGAISHFTKTKERSPRRLFYAVMSGAVMLWACVIAFMIYSFTRIVYD